ncbi:MAG: hypothetical protein M4579_006383 [Chaenotheca gracillima]|nr:MAG: hypothetical protein M4579_006383 [Chaenotheca gracillima]
MECLAAHYEAIAITYSGPFLIIECENLPAPDERPFLVADCIAVWKRDDERFQSDLAYYGEMAVGPPGDLPEDVAADLQCFCTPRAETLDAVARLLFPEALAVSYITTSVIVELPLTDLATFGDRLESLPNFIGNSTVGLTFVNGPLVISARRHRNNPHTIYVEGDYDDTDYVCKTNCLYPGSMIKSSEDNMTSAGIAVSKGPETRLTVAMHGWDEELDREPNDLGDPNDFKVYQADTLVGNVVSRQGKTDIGLATIAKGVSFNQRFLDVDCTPRKLLHSSQLKFQDVFVLDSPSTGKQPLLFLGMRRAYETGRSTEDANIQDDSFPHLKSQQLVFATNSPEISGMPKIRDGVCGSALVRQRKAGSKECILSQGEVAAFMTWSELAAPNESSDRLTCFCDSVNSLIEDGWEVAQMRGEKREREDDATTGRETATAAGKKGNAEASAVKMGDCE